MKKFIKDWWPLMVIAVLFVLKATAKPKGKLELRIAGYKPTGQKCTECGAEIYARGAEGSWMAKLKRSLRDKNLCDSVPPSSKCSNPDCITNQMLY
jgi:hypothetical protein